MKTLARTIALLVTLTFAATVAGQDSPVADDHAGGIVDGPGQLPLDRFGDRIERARFLLSSHHELPGPEVFETYLGEPRTILAGIARDDEQLSFYRKQALSALSYWPDIAVFQLYTDLFADEETPDNLRHRLMFLLVDAFPDHALARLEPYLRHDDLQFRLTAIEAIRRLPSEEVVDALRRAKEAETNDVARRRLEQYTRTVR